MTELINSIGAYLSTVPEGAKLWVVLAFLVVAFWLLLIMGRFFVFFIKITWFCFSGETERRVIRHWFFGKERLAPPSDLTPFVLSYEIEREHFWQQIKAGQNNICAPYTFTDKGVGTCPRLGFLNVNSIRLYKCMVDVVVTKGFKSQMESLSRIKCG
ncbi:MAG: hypothetical protein ACI9TY_001574 [Alphaproteobacteria bacterium]|jgi:hypothetical protein